MSEADGGQRGTVPISAHRCDSPRQDSLEASRLGEKVVADGHAVLGEGLVLVAAGLAVVLKERNDGSSEIG